MDKFLKKSIEHAIKLFPNHRSGKPYGCFHFAFGWKRSNLIAIGYNKTAVMDKKAYDFAIKHNLSHKLKYPYLHAEEDLISKLINKDELNQSVKIVVIRLNRFLQLGESKPCKSCSTILKAIDVNCDRVWWSSNDGNIYRGI